MSMTARTFVPHIRSVFLVKDVEYGWKDQKFKYLNIIYDETVSIYSLELGEKSQMLI